MEQKRLIGHEIHTLDNMIGRQIFSICKDDGLTKMQGWIIRYLYDHADEYVFQKDLEVQFRIARSTATGILQLMEKKGFLEREPVSSDARLKRLVLTQKGISHQLTVIERMTQFEQMLQKNIPPQSLEIFFEVIRQMKQNVEDNTAKLK